MESRKEKVRERGEICMIIIVQKHQKVQFDKSKLLQKFKNVTSMWVKN